MEPRSTNINLEIPISLMNFRNESMIDRDE